MLQRGGMTPPTCVLLAGLLMALVSGPVQAQSTDGDPALLDDGRPLPVPPAVIAGNDRGVTVRATRITAPMTIDGRLDEAIYAQVPAITAFVQQEPRYGTAVSEATSAWVFYDDANFYVACRCLMADMGQVVANDMRRDSTNLRQNDNFGVFLDTFHDRRNGYLFYVSPVGGMFDGATANERTNNADWNTVWNAKVTRSPDGWSAEIVIPFKSLRYQPGREQTWGINLRRTIRGRNEYAYIAPLRPEWGVGGFFRASAAATLVGLEVPSAGKNLELKPYAVSRLTTDRIVTPQVRNDLRQDVGLDVKLRRDHEPGRRLHLQHGFRAGRSGRSAGQPDALQSAVSGEARVLPGGAGHLHVWRRDRGWQRRRADGLLQPSHRPRRRQRRADWPGRPAGGTGGPLQHRRAEHLDRPGITVPVGRYGFQHAVASWTPGQQHRLSGVLAVDVGQFYDGTRQTASVNARLGITNQFGIEPNISLNWLSRGSARATVRVAGARATYTMTPRMFVAILVQHSTTSRSLAANLRFRWEYQPGSELFVVYSDAHDTSDTLGRYQLQNRGVVVKFNKLFRF